MTNAEMAKIMREIAFFLDMEEVPFKPRAYEKAAYAIEALDASLDKIYRRGGIKAVEEVPGVGKSIAEKLVTLIGTGKLPYYEDLRKKSPVDVEHLTAIEGLGPKKIKVLYDQLGIRTVDNLEHAAMEGKIHQLLHFGEKSEQKIVKGISFFKKSGSRYPIGAILPLIREIIHHTGTPGLQDRPQGAGLGEFRLIVNQRMLLATTIEEGLQQVALRIVHRDGNPVDQGYPTFQNRMDRFQLFREGNVSIQIVESIPLERAPFLKGGASA